MIVVRNVVFTCVLASLLPAQSLVVRGGDLEWEQWLNMTKDGPQWSGTWAHQRQPYSGPGLRVAVFCSGVLKRFFLEHTASGLIEPMAMEGHRVDYYVALNFANFHSYHSGADTLLEDSQFLNKTEDTVTKMIEERISAAGGRSRAVRLFDGVDLDASDYKWINNHNNMQAKANVVKKLKPLQWLYEDAEKEEAVSGNYDIMIFLDDDSIWLRPFSLRKLLNIPLESKVNKHPNPHDRQLFTLHCGPDSTTITPDWGYLSEYIFVVNRTVAAPFGKQYSILTKNRKGLKLYNLEQFSWRLAYASKANLMKVPPSAIPMQRAGRVADENGTVYTCLHKKCMDWPEDPWHLENLDPTQQYPVCSEALSHK